LRSVLRFCIFVVAPIAAFFYLRGEPFEMRLTPAEHGAIVQFAMPSKSLVSPKFPVDLELDRAHVVELRSDEIPIEGCVVETYDPTMFPGMFRIRVGSTRFYLISVLLKADDKEYDWIAE